MADLSTTQTFLDGDQVTAAKMNNIVGNASLLPTSISGKSAKNVADGTNDYVLMYDNTTSTLVKANPNSIRNATGSVSHPSNLSVAGTLGVVGNLSVNTNKATIDAVTGNTTIGGALAVTGAITATSATINGTTIPATKTLVTTVDTQTLTNKTLTTPVISSISNTGTISLPTSTDTLVGRATTDTLTNKTLTSPVISSISNTGTITLPTSTDTLVGRATTDTLTNKTLTSPVISTITNTGTLTLPTSTDTLVGRATTDTLTNKTLTSPNISGGTINNATIGATTASSASFTTLTASGNVGIGPNNPQGKLTISDASTSCTLTPDTANTRFVIGTDGASALALSTNAGTRMTISPAGDIGMGVYPAAALHLRGAELRLSSSVANTTGKISLYEIGTAAWEISTNGAGGKLFIKDTYAAGSPTRMTIIPSGAVGIGTDTPTNLLHVAGDGYFNGSITAGGNVTAYSDERLKKNWLNLEEGFVDKLSQVKSGTYDRIDVEGLRQIGVSAQSVRSLAPEAVIEGADGHLSVAYGNLAMSSCVELAKEIVALRQEIALLKSKIG